MAGVDGSDSSKAALRWALRQAELTDSVVDAVTAWDIPVTYGWTPMPGGTDLEGAARKMLDDVLAEVAGAAGGARVRPLVVRGNAARVLLDAARGADLLVLGTRGYGGFAEALLGSVSQHCVHHAACPVVIVR